MKGAPISSIVALVSVSTHPSCPRGRQVHAPAGGLAMDGTNVIRNLSTQEEPQQVIIELVTPINLR